jgi:hypothetical protein
VQELEPRRTRRTSALFLVTLLLATVFAVAVPSAPAAAVPGGTWLEVVLNEQRTVVRYPNGAVMAEFPMSSGASGKTPLGRYRIGRKSRTAISSSNSAVSMLWMSRFYGGIGFHSLPRKGGRVIATPLGIRPVSNGCIRLADANAKWIYDNLPAGTLVVVTRARTVGAPAAPAPPPPPPPPPTTTTLPPLPRRWSPVTTAPAPAAVPTTETTTSTTTTAPPSPEPDDE